MRCDNQKVLVKSYISYIAKHEMHYRLDDHQTCKTYFYLTPLEPSYFASRLFPRLSRLLSKRPQSTQGLADGYARMEGVVDQEHSKGTSWGLFQG